MGGEDLIAAPVSVEEYLSNPSYERCEYVDGAVVERNIGSRIHSGVQVRCGRRLDEYFDTRPRGYVGISLHCRLHIGGRVRFRLPDVAVVLGDFKTLYFERGPDLAVEIRSPEDSIASQLRKIDDYFANGTRLAWLILPEEQSVLVLQPG